MSDATIRQSYDRHELYDKMVEEWDIFDSYLDFFVFAASVGYRKADEVTVRNYTQKEYEGESEMLWMHFSNKDTYRAVSASIAFQYTGDPDALVNPDIQLEILARYAKAGIEILDQEFGDSVSTPRDGLLAFIDEHQAPDEDETEPEILEDIVNSFDRDMFDSE